MGGKPREKRERRVNNLHSDESIVLRRAHATAPIMALRLAELLPLAASPPLESGYSADRSPANPSRSSTGPPRLLISPRESRARAESLPLALRILITIAIITPPSLEKKFRDPNERSTAFAIVFSLLER